MKRKISMILAVMLCTALCFSASAYEMQMIVRERDLHDLFTTETFCLPDDLPFGTGLEEAIEWLPLSETMRPGEEAFDARKYTELPDNGFYTLRPFLCYSFPETEGLELVMEFDSEKRFYGFWLVSEQYPVEQFGEEEKTAVPQLLLALSEVFEERSEPILLAGPEKLKDLEWSYFENGGELRAVFMAKDFTFCQLCANVYDGYFSFRIGIGDGYTWPGFMETLTEYFA